GDVLLTGLYGLITTVMGTFATTIQLWHTPTLGAVQVDLCGAHATISDYLAGTFFTITGAHGDAMVSGNGTEGVGVASFETNLVILVPGTISLNVGAAGNDGVIQWVIHWIPLSEQSDLVLA
ncbi:unnamed protein product, partial [marine sediment metagenome]